MQVTVYVAAHVAFHALLLKMLMICCLRTGCVHYCTAFFYLAHVLQLLLSKWDPAMSRDMLAHWLDLMNKQGWIAREQVCRSACTAQPCRTTLSRNIFTAASET